MRKSREKRKKRVRSKLRFRKGRIERVISERIVFADIDDKAEVDLDVDVDLHGMARGGRSRS